MTDNSQNKNTPNQTLDDVTLVSISGLSLHYRQKKVLQNLNWKICRGDSWLLGGASGSGKTALAKAITGEEKYQGIIDIRFCTESNLPAQCLFVSSWYQFKNLEGDANFYYQQRYNHKQQKDTLTVQAELEKYGAAHQLDIKDLEYILEALNFSAFRHAQLIELSSGEHKKLQLVEAIWLKPQLLIIDQPYTGLDATSRRNLNDLLDDLCSAGVTLVLICNDDELPININRFAMIENGQIHEKSSFESTSVLPHKILGVLPDFLMQSPAYTSKEIVRMENVNISYGDNQVLKNVNWEIIAGEKWLLQGHNGSGKSTLLSLINGDHPQAYANEIYLFGNKRGSGESIWDIKKRIGLISPEFHWYFDRNATVWESVASGFYDSVGLFQQLPYSKKIQVDELLEYFELTTEKNELLNSLPLGKQRLALLARTIIKNPELLVLDEPCQGLDLQQTQHFNQLINELSKNGMTIIYVGHFETQLPTCIEKRILLEKGEVKVVENILESV
ncbi:ATP-binding cassette domain-containing protein [Pedobacter sp. AW1-32]|uniref:ATP-binding cassette domain-containing protein n=1 Tax=Pedobacter sp. AW1-32 TaxID=3383026 RepID=UPI003FED8F8A